MNTAYKKFKEFFVSLADIIRLARPVDPFTQQMMYSGTAEASHMASTAKQYTNTREPGEFGDGVTVAVDRDRDWARVSAMAGLTPDGAIAPPPPGVTISREPSQWWNTYDGVPKVYGRSAKRNTKPTAGPVGIEPKGNARDDKTTSSTEQYIDWQAQHHVEGRVFNKKLVITWYLFGI